MIKIGDIEIHRLNESRIWMDSGGVFGLVPRALWSQVVTPDEASRLPHDHWCLLVRAGGRMIVVDTGQGSKLSEKEIGLLSLSRETGTLGEQLAGLGVAPEDVDLVINTHLHGDHCGGNTRYEGEEIVPVFPNAEYWVQRLEYADAAFPNERTRATYRLPNYTPLYDSGQMCLIDGEVEVVPGMRCVPTPGHTRGHQSIVFEQGNEAAMFVADLATYAIHFARLAWMTAYDVEPLVTLETKRLWQQWALERDALLIFQHEPITPVGRLVEEEEGRLNIVRAEEG